MEKHLPDAVRAIRWSRDHLVLLDQRLLPRKEEYLHIGNAGETARAIADMVVRGAPAIGIAAAYGVVLAARKRHSQSPSSWYADLHEDLELLANSRPTAVNLSWALRQMRRVAEQTFHAHGDLPPLPALLEAARRIHQRDVQANHVMGALGTELLTEKGAILTHCNTGSLATGGFGTALGVIRTAWSRGLATRIFADETRPWLQGARLTAWELARDGIPVTLLVDSASSWLLRQGEVRWVVVGADRIAANGDVANKIGTYNLALGARQHGVGFMVVAPTSTVDMNLASGAEIPIETRSSDELLGFGGVGVAPGGTQAWNPVFDVTPAELIDAIVTERGVVENPNSASMATLMGRN